MRPHGGCRSYECLHGSALGAGSDRATDVGTDGAQHGHACLRWEPPVHDDVGRRKPERLDQLGASLVVPSAMKSAKRQAGLPVVSWPFTTATFQHWRDTTG